MDRSMVPTNEIFGSQYLLRELLPLTQTRPGQAVDDCVANNSILLKLMTVSHDDDQYLLFRSIARHSFVAF